MPIAPAPAPSHAVFGVIETRYQISHASNPKNLVFGEGGPVMYLYLEIDGGCKAFLCYVVQSMICRVFHAMPALWIGIELGTRGCVGYYNVEPTSLSLSFIYPGGVLDEECKLVFLQPAMGPKQRC